MTCHYRARSLAQLAAFGVVVLLGVQSGCQLGEIRNEDNSYFSYRGMRCGVYTTGLVQARVAALTALTELKMPVYEEGPLGHGIYIDTRTPDDYPVRIELATLGVLSRAEREVTRIGVRVGGFGTHRAVCERLLDQIAQRLAAVPTCPFSGHP